MVDATRFLGAWLRAGGGIGWLAAGTMPNSLYRMPLVYLFLTWVFCYSCSFLFVVFFLCVCVCVFLLLSLELGRCSSDFFCPADHVPDWQPRVLLGMVEARSVNVKKTTTTTTNKVEKRKLNPMLKTNSSSEWTLLPFSGNRVEVQHRVQLSFSLGVTQSNSMSRHGRVPAIIYLLLVIVSLCRPRPRLGGCLCLCLSPSSFARMRIICTTSSI